MLTAHNYQQAEIHFDHVFSRRKGDSLPIVIRPIDPEKDRFAAKQLMAKMDSEPYEADGTEESLANLNNTVDAKNFLRDAQEGYSNPNKKNLTRAITIEGTTIGFVSGYPFPNIYIMNLSLALQIVPATYKVMTDFSTNILGATAKEPTDPDQLFHELVIAKLTPKKVPKYKVITPE